MNVFISMHIFQTIIGLLDSEVHAKYRSAGLDICRKISSSKQYFDENEESWPIGKPIRKLESRVQISGITSI